MIRKFIAPAILFTLFTVFGIVLYVLIARFVGTDDAGLPQTTEMALQAPSGVPTTDPTVEGAGGDPKGSGPNEPLPADPAPLSAYAFVGTATNPGGSAFAVLRNQKTGIQRLLAEGDALDDGIIESIAPEHVIVRRNGRPYLVYRSGHRDEGGFQTPLDAHDLPPRDFSRPDPERMERGWEAVRNLMVQIELNANTNDGEPDGVIVGDVRTGSVFEGAGLKAGDIIHRINGRQIVIESDAMEIYEVFRSEDQIEMEIVREGAPITLEYRQ